MLQTELQVPLINVCEEADYAEVRQMADYAEVRQKAKEITSLWLVLKKDKDYFKGATISRSSDDSKFER